MERIGVLPGTEIGGYRVLSPLGHGGSGAVYRAVDADGRLVALKLLHPHLGIDPDARERLRREVANLQKVRHDAVARVLDAEIDQSDAFLVTELLDGEDLGARVRSRGPLSPDDLADLAERLAAALAVVHEAGVLHRDLSPGNVLLASRGPVLIDFGIAQAADDGRVTSTGLVSGTPGFVPPELLEGGEPDTGSDWWSWTALLAFAATGRPPFGTRPLQAVLARVQRGEADLTGLDRRTAAALRSGLAVDPWRRSTADQVVAELEAAATGDVGGWAEAGEDDGVPADGSPEDVGQGDRDDELTVVAGTRLMPAGPAPEATGDDAEVTTALDTYPATDPEAPVEGYDDDYDGDAYGDGTYGDGTYDDAAHADVGDEEPDRYDEDLPDPFDDGGLALPEPPRRRGTVLAIGLLLVALAATRPGVALVLAVGLALAVRTVGIAVRATQTRRARRGRRPSDTTRAVLLAPWYLLRAAGGLLAATLVAASAVVLVGGLGWWLLDTGRLVVAAPGPGEEAGVLAGNAAWVTAALLALAGLVGLLVLWYGPMSVRTRLGARWTLHAVAPGTAGAAAVVLVALAGVAALLTLAGLGHEVVWWPLPGEPDLR